MDFASTYVPIRGKEVTMDVFVQSGGPAFVLDGYQWYSSTAPLCRVMRGGGGRKRTRNVWGRKNRARDRGNKNTALANKKHSLE